MLDESWFSLENESYEIELDRVSRLINLTDLISNLGFFLIDYGYVDILKNCLPYSKSEFQQQRPFIYQNFNHNTYRIKVPTYEKYKDSSIAYLRCLDFVIKRFKGRELVIASLVNSGYKILDGKLIYYWNPYKADNIISQRTFIQSAKHKYKRKDLGETYCPISDEELECSLQRAVSLQDNHSFELERYELCSYHEKYELVIKNKYTTDSLTSLENNFKFSYNYPSLKIKEINYHGFHINSASDEGQRIVSLMKESSIPVNLDITKSKQEFIKREQIMIREMS